MNRYRVYFCQTVANFVTVEAESEDEARTMFEEEGPECGDYSLGNSSVIEEEISDVLRVGEEAE